MKYVLEHRVRKWRNNTGTEPQSYWVTEALAEEEHNTFPSLEVKSKSSSDFSLAYIMPVEIILCSHAVFLLVHLPLYNCLNVANFCQILQGGSGLKGIEFLRVSCRWAAAHLLFLLREGQQFELCSCWMPEHMYKERGYQSPCCKKSGKGACSLFSIRVCGQETLSWGEASCRRCAFWNYLFHEKALVLSSHRSLRAGSSGWKQAPAHGQSKVPQSQRREGFGILHFRNGVLLLLL